MKCHHCTHESSLPIPDETVPSGVIDPDKEDVKYYKKIIIRW